MARPPQLLVFCSQEDRPAIDGILNHLAPEVRAQKISVLDVTRIPPGVEIRAWTDEAIDNADAVLMALSESLLFDNSFRRDSLPRLRDRQRQLGLRLLPLPLRPCPWSDIAELRGLQPLPSLYRSIPGRQQEVELRSARRAEVELRCAEHLLQILLVDPEHGASRAPAQPPPSAPGSGALPGGGGGSPHAAGGAAQPTGGGPRPTAPWGVFAGLLVLFLLLVAATLVYGPLLLGEQQALVTVGALAAIALAAVLLLTGEERGTGHFKLSKGTSVRGPAAVFLIIVVCLVSAVVALRPTPTESIVRGYVVGLPPGRDAWVQAIGCEKTDVNRDTGLFTLPLQGPCDLPTLDLLVGVTGSSETQPFQRPRPPRGQRIADNLHWRQATERISTITATFRGPGQRPIPGVKVRLIADCPEAATMASVETGRDGRFLLPNIPPACATGPLKIEYALLDGRMNQHTLLAPLNEYIDLPAAPPASDGGSPRPAKAANHERGASSKDDCVAAQAYGDELRLPTRRERGTWLELRRDASPVGFGVVRMTTDNGALMSVSYLSGTKKDLRACPLPALPHIKNALGVINGPSSSGDSLDINLGRPDGVKVGDRYQVLGDAVIDHTFGGRSLGRAEVGTIEVVAMGIELFSKAKIVSGEAPPRAFIVLMQR